MHRRVLYISPFGAYGGATRSLLELILAMNPDDISMEVIVASGISKKCWFPSSVGLTETEGLLQWDNTRFGYYRGFRWLILIREMSRVLATIRIIRKMTLQHSQQRFDLIHCNEITFLPTAIMLRKALAVPLVVHVRSLQAGALAPLRSAIINRALQKHADAIVAIDESVARTLEKNLSVNIIHNSMELPNKRSASVIRYGPISFGLVGSLSVSKGVLELLKACAILKRRGVPFKLLVAGENVRKVRGLKGKLLEFFNFSRDIETEAREIVIKENLQDHVEFLGFVKDTDQVYSKIDVLCFPSHLDAPGRPVFEAALYGIPSIVAQKMPPDDVIKHKITGLVIDSPCPALIADAMEEMHINRTQTKLMGSRAREIARERFDSKITAGKIKKLYEFVLSKGI